MVNHEFTRHGCLITITVDIDRETLLPRTYWSVYKDDDNWVASSSANQWRAMTAAVREARLFAGITTPIGA